MRDAALLASRPANPFDADLLRDAMRRSAGGVSIITAGRGLERAGMTVTSAISQTMAPPTMLVAVDLTASTLPVLTAKGHFAVNIPSARQVDVAERFAGRGGLKGAARYAGAEWFRLGSGTWGLVDALAVIDCRVEEIIERHSHAIVLGAVEAVHLGSDASAEPLAYAAGAFARAMAAVPA